MSEILISGLQLFGATIFQVFKKLFFYDILKYMAENNYKGKFIVFEGIDGSGKATQVRLLTAHLEREGLKARKVDFPRHGEPSAYFVDAYLNGKYGPAKEVGPYRGSIFYTLDRYDMSFDIKKWLSQGEIVVADRYVASNIGHQGGKIKDREERKKYFNWLYDLEYNLFNIPKPSATFILKTSPELSLKMANNITDKNKKERRKSYLGDDKKQDIHEKDKGHQSATLESYLQAAEFFPEEFRVVECVENNRLLPSEKIHEIIWDIIKDII
jgi:thymidylate kinase